MPSSPILIIAGPTASGKSALALDLAKNLSGVVINADSMQMYRGLPILTAQPSAEDVRLVSHALYGVLDPSETCSAATWRMLALVEIEKAHANNKIPILTGGTGFYIKALLEGLSPIPQISVAHRARAVALQKELGNPAFHAELKKRDPETASRLDPLNTQRNVRAWEVLEGTGKGLAAWQTTPREPPPAHLKFFTVVLAPPREALRRNCDLRFDAMLQAGAVEEASAFAAKIKAGDIPQDAPLVKALGFREISDFLEGNITVQEAADTAKQATRAYAKRQTTWFRGQLKADMLLETPDSNKVLTGLRS